MAAELRIDQRSTGGSATRRDIAGTRKEIERFGKSSDDIANKSGKSSSGIRRMGASVGMLAKSFGPLAAVAGAGLLAKFGVDSIRAASDTQQAMGAVDAVFGKSSRTVKQWATDAADSVGLAKSEYGNLAVVLGSMLKNQGIKGFAGQTKELIGLGSDLAAQFGGTTKEAVEAIGSLMRGEADPIERYGVSIKQSGINAVLAARGQSKLTGAARTQAEAQARLHLLTKQTTSSQGAFRRESNTLAGSQQRLSARFTNLKSTLGSKLLPVATRVVQWLGNTVNGSNRTAAVLRRVGAVIRSYVTPILNGFKGAWKDVTNAIQGSKKQGDGFGIAVRAVGRVAQKVAPILGKILGNNIRIVGKLIAGTITVISRWVTMIQSVVTWCRNAASAVGDLIDKLGSIASHVPKIKLPFGIGRGEGVTRDLRPAGPLLSGAALGGTSFQVAPTIHVTIGRRELRSVVVDIVQGELRETRRRNTGGGEDG